LILVKRLVALGMALSFALPVSASPATRSSTTAAELYRPAPAPAETEPWTSKPIVWILAGTVLVGAGVVAALIAARPAGEIEPYAGTSGVIITSGP
jgi:hypothetical protein